VNPPRVQSRVRGGGGFVCWDGESVFPLGYYHESVRRGLGKRCEIAGGFENVAHLHGSVRWQVAGCEEGGRPPGGPAPDVCIEAGVSAASFGTAGGASVFAGIEASIPRPERTWYLAYRRYSGVVQDTSDPVDPNKGVTQNMVFLGVGLDDGRFVELFYAWTPRLDLFDRRRFRAVGLNILRRRF
jgi:hypothetical protein